MNTTSFIVYSVNSTTIPIISWFIPGDAFLIFCSILIIVLAIFFLFTIIIDKTCHTIPMLLVANSSLTAFIVGCVTLSMAIFTLQNDLKQLDYQDSLCITRAYIGYAAYGILNFSFFLQALYRYMIVVYPKYLFYQSIRFQNLLICLTWIFGLLYPCVFLFTNEITYTVDNQICQTQLHLSVSVIYGAFCAYTLPISLIILMYLKLVRYVKEMSKNVATANVLSRAKRELKMIRRIVILVMILIGIAFPYMLVMFMSFFTDPVKYHYRIAYIFFDASTVSVMVCLFQITDPLKASVIKRLHVRPNVIV